MQQRALINGLRNEDFLLCHHFAKNQKNTKKKNKTDALLDFVMSQQKGDYKASQSLATRKHSNTFCPHSQEQSFFLETHNCHLA